MFDSPATAVSIDELEAFADWIELCALFASSGTFSRDSAEEVLRDASLLGLDADEFFPGDFSFIDTEMISQEEASGRFIEEVWRVLHARVRRLGRAYPFDLANGVLIERREDSWRRSPAYSMLLLTDVGRYYAEAEVNIEPNSASARLFEKVVEAACRGLFGPTCQRFGWPRETGWPTGVEERIARLGEAVRLETENLEGRVGRQDKDRGLDVVARIDVGDEWPGGLYVLLQCASGANFKDKSGEPQITYWSDLLKWRATLVRGVAVPWQVPRTGLWGLERYWRHFDALILDRMRLLHGCPDSYLQNSTRQGVIRWCSHRIEELPRLAG